MWQMQRALYGDGLNNGTFPKSHKPTERPGELLELHADLALEEVPEDAPADNCFVLREPMPRW